MSQAWADVVATALVGTDRRPVPGGPTGLLDSAAALGLSRRGGVGASVHVSPIGTAPDDQARPAPPAATDRLAGLLDPFDPRDAETRLELVAEWLEAGRLVPGEWLPPLLELGRRHRRLRPLLLAAGGQRARWLAGLRQDWRYLLGEADERELGDAWDLAPIGRRVGHLMAVRRRDPAAARDQLTATWDTESGDDRAALLKTFHIGLSTSDEDLLERALDDRRREVRAVAVDLLGRLPSSRYGTRMASRARAAVRVRPGRVDVRPPGTCDAAMQRDGIAARPPSGTGQRAWWLEEVLAHTPLGVWELSMLDLPVAEEWASVVRRGLARAAAAQGDGVWAAALVDRLWPEATAAQRMEDRLLLEALYEALPSDGRAARAAAVLRRDPGRAAAAGVERLLELCPRPWPSELAAAVVSALEVLVRGGAATWRLTGLATLAGTRLPVSTVDDVEALRGRLTSSDVDGAGGAAWGGGAAGGGRLAAVDGLVALLRFRQEMLSELHEERTVD